MRRLLATLLLLTACSTRPTLNRPEGLGTTSLAIEPRTNGYRITATGGLLRFVNRGDSKIRYHAAPELVFSPTGQLISATEDSLTLDPGLRVPVFLKSTFSVCSDGVASYREESGKQQKVGRLTLTYFPKADKLKSLENGFLEATPEAGEPVDIVPDGNGESCR